MKIEIYVAVDRKYKKKGKSILEKGGQMNILFIKYGDNYYNPYVLEFDYFIARARACFERGIIDVNEAGLFIVRDMTRDCIIETVLKAYESEFFDRLLPCKFNNGEIFYNMSKGNQETFMEYGDAISISPNDLVMIYPVNQR